ncbi:DUF6090 family protein [Eudoraea adriatica]|uniref:DUF6090 family protein n=1 Tax=Eudoraea adriatica TaxID=446681 RepID=UPI0003812FA3|nr:DUF6090 family protein [Eudoraea adriatica]
MIKFFRHIRKQLLTENPPAGSRMAGKFSKYLLYAIGEIVLVVIGILIALSINNWNEERKTRKIEKRILEELVENLEFNTDRLEQWVIQNRRHNRSSEIIAKTLENKLPYNDSLGRHFGWATTMRRSELLSEVGYESLKNVGLEIVQNKQLKKYIVLLFERNYKEIKSKIEQLNPLINELLNVRQKRFIRLQGFNFKPLDYPNLLIDIQFQSYMASLKEERGWFNRSLEDSLQETQKVLQLVKEELNN